MEIPAENMLKMRNYMGNIQIDPKQYQKILKILDLYPKFQINISNYRRHQFIETSTKYEHDYEFLDQTIKLFSQYKDEFNNHFNDFLDKI